MSQKFKTGDLAIVRLDEGLDTPCEARGQVVKVEDYIGDLQYTVRLQDGQTFCACEYHLLELPSVVRLDLPEVQVVNLLNLDPDLREHVIDARAAIPELHDKSLVTILFTMAWLGYRDLQENSRLLKGSGINEVIKDYKK